MDPILVPSPPRSAYNQNRRVSDLLLKQLQHFQHVEKKRGDLGIDPEIARDIHTEGGAAKYIAAVTNALRGGTSPKPANLASMPAAKAATKPVPIALAASAATAPAPVRKSPAEKVSKNAAKKAVAKKAAKSAATRKK